MTLHDFLAWLRKDSKPVLSKTFSVGSDGLRYQCNTVNRRVVGFYQDIPYLKYEWEEEEL